MQAISATICDMGEDARLNKGNSDLILWLLAAAMAIFLFLVQKTPFWTGVCLAGLTVVLIHPVTQILWIRDNIIRRAAAAVLTVVFVIIFGLSIWPRQAGNNWIYSVLLSPATKAELLGITTKAWFQKSLWIAVGVVLLRLFQGAVRQLSSLAKSRTDYRQPGEKGFLDYKMQVEEGMRAYTPEIEKITQITSTVGKLMGATTGRIPKWTNQSARTQVMQVRKVANKLHKYSMKLDIEGLKLKEISDSLIEGTDGWMAWISLQNNRETVAIQVCNPMVKFVVTLTGTLQIINQYLISVESIRGVTREMNKSVEAHLESVKRIRDITESLKKSYSEALRLLGHPIE